MRQQRGGGASEFCNDWAAAFCHRVWTCTTDPASDPFAGASEAECTSGYAMLCSQPQVAGQTFDVNCSGKQVNQAAKTSCLDRLNTVSCDDFNAATYNDDCDMVCTTTPTGEGGAGGTQGTGGTGGSGGSTATCGSVQPCGGDLVGTWSITSACVDSDTVSDPNCPAASIGGVTAAETGTLTFASGGTYSVNVSLSLSYTEMTPLSCIEPATCADVEASYQLIGASAVCSESTVCTCMVALGSDSTEAGTYATSGSSVTVTPTGDSPSTMGYCVQGDMLHFLHFDSAGRVTTEEIARRQ